MADNLLMKPIGIIHTPFLEQEGTPIQPAAACHRHQHHTGERHHHIPLAETKEARGHIELFPEFEAGLKDIEGFERIILVFYFHQVCREELVVHPYLEPENLHGVFATRAPCRPNRIGISCVRLTRVAGTVLYVEEVDMLDGTPLLDIKPYVPQFDSFSHVKTGWIGNADIHGRKADSRFA